MRVKIMLAHDPEGKKGPKGQLPDKIEIMEPKVELAVREAYSDVKDRPAAPGAPPAAGAGPTPGAPIMPVGMPAPPLQHMPMPIGMSIMPGMPTQQPPQQPGGQVPSVPPVQQPQGPGPIMPPGQILPAQQPRY